MTYEPKQVERMVALVPVGMKSWAGGDSAPADWDGGIVRLRNGSGLNPAFKAIDWEHMPDEEPHLDVIAYTPLPASQPGDGEVTQACAEDLTELDVFLAAYRNEPDGDLVNREETDDLLTWGILRRVYASAAHADTQTAAMRAERDALARAVIEAVALIDEVNERKPARVFYGINQVLHAKLATVRATLARARVALTGEREA